LKPTFASRVLARASNETDVEKSSENADFGPISRYIIYRGGSRISEGGFVFPPLPFLSLPFLSLPSPPFPLPLSSPPLEVGPLNPARGPGERCKLPQRGLGRSPSRNRI